MKTLLRAGVGALLGVLLVLGPAYAIEYDDIFELTDRGVSDRTIVQLIVDDGRAFELTDEELDDLRAADVSEIVIDAMLDPEVGRAWLAGERDGYGGGSGYSTSLDEAYGQGYGDGYEQGRSTALVYSFGYYYGPLARYYYCDPFYYPFWYSGYGYSYWPSYCAYWYRPSYAWYYPYPYNWYTYSSYYCYTYYDPGYWVHNGYTVLPGYGRTIWDDGPRWRDGGVTPPKGGRPAAAVSGPATRLREGRVVDGSGRSLRGPAAPPAIREALGTRQPTDRVAKPGARTPAQRTPVVRTPESAPGRDVARRPAVDRGERPTRRGGQTDVTKGRVVRDREDTPRRTPETTDRVGRREAVQRSYGRPGGSRPRGENRIERPAEPRGEWRREPREDAVERSRPEFRPEPERREAPAPREREPAPAPREREPAPAPPPRAPEKVDRAGERVGERGGDRGREEEPKAGRGGMRPDRPRDR